MSVLELSRRVCAIHAHVVPSRCVISMAFVNLKKRMTQRSAIDIGMDLAAPTIVIPEGMDL